ncbi:hypothetical protein Fsol_00632 [Candidatus Fokinia solitaria]|uniref:Uncharacterized protein n=1 Tax=Candidatus Fokinia solitaria TaxID=1802984 RepID=A0A2U8BSU2_9RICK|nr:hypothetical protein [Candidatus Fokinia solitaria]AWD33411.1 hypothetical protein Fsol_00632 [Candidatus Fokinia solitaria]
MPLLILCFAVCASLITPLLQSHAITKTEISYSAIEKSAFEDKVQSWERRIRYLKREVEDLRTKISYNTAGKKKIEGLLWEIRSLMLEIEDLRATTSYPSVISDECTRLEVEIKWLKFDLEWEVRYLK